MYNDKKQLTEFDSQGTHFSIANGTMINLCDGNKLNPRSCKKYFIGKKQFGPIDGTLFYRHPKFIPD